MPIGALIHAIFFLAEDFFAWKLGNMGVPFWVVLVGGFILIYFFWGHIYKTIRIILSKIGVG